MKKIIAVLMLMLIIMPIEKPIAKDIYNYSFETNINLGKDNINSGSYKNIFPQMAQGSTQIINNIVILVRFKGEAEYINEVNLKNLNNTYNFYSDSNLDNVADAGAISLNSYVSDLTYGQIKVKSTFYPAENAEYMSIEAPYTREYYEQYLSGSQEEIKFVKWAFDSIKDKIKLSGNELDRNNDGEIDMVTVICSGQTKNNNMLWPHKASISEISSINDKQFGTYNLINIGDDTNNLFNKGNLRIAIHEFLHGFTYPDLYRYYNRGTPVGEWDIMANSIGYGQLPLVYTRNFYNNLNLNIEEINSDGVYKLKYSQSSNKNDVIAFKIKSPLRDKEYFMVEFRKNEGNWDSALPGSGLIVYRVNENVNSFDGNKNGYPDYIYVFRQGDVNSTSSIGNTKTAFLSSESGRTSIGNSNLNGGFVENSLFFDNGENSGIVISEVGSAKGSEITFRVTFPKSKKEVNYTKVVGSDRYDTAAKLSRESFISSNTVILANGLALADGLAGTPLASYLKSPILLVKYDNIPKVTIDEIKRIGAKNVIIVGGEGVVSSSIYSELNSIGIQNIKRLAGINRYETSLEIAKFIDSNCYNIEDIVVTNGVAEADAMSISSIAGRKNMPIILTESKEVNKSTYSWLKQQNLRNAFIIGGEGVISNNIINQINQITSLDIVNNRLGGINRYETNAIVINKFKDNNVKSIYLAKGLTLIDALTAGPIASTDGVIILTENNLTESQKYSVSGMDINKVVESGGGISINSVNDMKKILN